jgi:DNA-directed RNA polymerase specialized sigma24 family protein
MENAIPMNAVGKSTTGGGPGPAAGGHAFPTTQWSMILHSGADTDTQARAALESLCRLYWKPLYTFVRRRGRDHHDAEDATQQFIAHLLAADSLQHARPERGRFRTFLLTGLRNFLTSDWRRTRAAKRGGGFAAVAVGPRDASDAPTHEPADPGLTPEHAFDRSWAQGMIERAVAELRAEFQASGREKVFEAMAPLIWGADTDDAIAGRATAVDLTSNAFRVAVHRARRRLGERLRAQIAETVADSREIDAELRHLIEALNGRT